MAAPKRPAARRGRGRPAIDAAAQRTARAVPPSGRLRGPRERHLTWLLRWFDGLTGADLSARSVRQTRLGDGGQRVPGAETIEVRHREGGRLLAIVELSASGARVTWCRPTHCGLVSRALRRLHDTFGGPP